jgi:hypothetical protein
VTEPGRPPLFVAGDPRNRQTGGLVGAVIAVVLLALGSGAAALYGLFVFPFIADMCGDSDTRFMCTSDGQMALMFAPMVTAVLGVAIAGGSLALRPGRREIGIMVGYLVGFSGVVTGQLIASQM